MGVNDVSMVPESQRVTIGPQKVTVEPGDHICGLYRGTQSRDEILIPFVEEALVQGDKVICVLDEPDPSRTFEALPAAATDRFTDHVGLFAAERTYLEHGEFRLLDMLHFWVDEVTRAMAAKRFRFVRSIGEMTWALRDAPGVRDVIRYENELNQSVWKQREQVSLCLYDLERFSDGALVIDILRTHPKVLLDGSLLENPWHVSPDEFLSE